MSQPPADRIFISYSRKDDEVMRKIAFHLRDQGFRVWVDNEKLVPGTAAWEEGIENAIKNALAVIVILSPDSKGSEWVRREITYADQFRKRVFPVLVKGSEEMSLPIRLVTRQFVDLRTDEEAGLRALSAAISFHLKEKQTLEMRRPQKGSHSPSDETPTSIKSRAVSKWILPAGIFLAICVLMIGALWVGTRILSSLPLPSSTEPASATRTLSTPTAIASPTAEDTPVPPEPVSDPGTTQPDKLSEYLEGVQIRDGDTFEDPSGRGWVIQAAVIRDGFMRIDGNANWDGAFYAQGVGSNEGIVMDFSYASGSLFEIFIDRGTYDTDSYKRFGIYIGGNTAETNIMEGRSNAGGTILAGDLVLEPEITYTVLIAVLADGEFLLVLWKPDEPLKSLSHRAAFDSTWANQTWTFFLQANRGPIFFDNFQKITFESVR